MPRNPSAALARRVAADPRWRRLGVEAHGRVLTTSYVALLTELAPALAAAPDAILMIGVAGRARAVAVEQLATGRRSLLFPDARGRSGQTLVSTAARRRSLAPAEPARRALEAWALPCRLSRDAGRYLCNAAYFQALAEPVPTLFVHIPKPPRPDRRAGARRRPRRLGWDERLAAGLVEVALALLRQGRALKERAG